MNKRNVRHSNVVPLPENVISVPKLTQSYIHSEMNRLSRSYPKKYKSTNKTVRSSKSPRARYELVTDLTYYLKEGKTFTPVMYDIGGFLISKDGKIWTVNVNGKEKYKLYVSNAEYRKRIGELNKSGISHILRFGEM